MIHQPLGGFGICWSGYSYPNHRFFRRDEVIWVPLSGSLTKSVARLDHRKAAPWTLKKYRDMDVSENVGTPKPNGFADHYPY